MKRNNRLLQKSKTPKNSQEQDGNQKICHKKKLKNDVIVHWE